MGDELALGSPHLLGRRDRHIFHCSGGRETMGVEHSLWLVLAAHPPSRVLSNEVVSRVVLAGSCNEPRSGASSASALASMNQRGAGTRSAAPGALDVALEVGKRRVFASAIEWPGWCRGGRDEDAALEALAEYRARYAIALGKAALGKAHARALPRADAALRVVERLDGDMTTDFGAPGTAPAADSRALDDGEFARQCALLRACWDAFDAAAHAHASAILRKGPRGGGREIPAMIAHVFEADRAYLARLAGSYRLAKNGDEMEPMRAAFVEALGARARGDALPAKRRATSAVWTPRYAVRRSAWHALDHAWEIEDRASP